MNVKFIKPESLPRVLTRLIDEHNEFHWAVAWGSLTNVAKKALDCSHKFKNVTFGIAFCQTDPLLIEKLVCIDGARVVTNFPGGTYHPKVYCFLSGNKAAAVVGSANFTFGGLGKNFEASILIEGDRNDIIFRDLFAFTKRSADLGKPVTQEFAAAYRASHRRALRMPKPSSNPMEDLPPVKNSLLSSSFISMNWNEYVKEVGAAEYHNVKDSLELLRIAQGWLTSVRSFSDLSLGKRQAIAGLTINAADRSNPDLDRDWGWFGSMRGMGDFVSLVNANDPHIARAIDSIPQKGEISKRHFDTFVKYFNYAFRNSERVGGYATASRLLALKRPDTFICLCNPNITEASKRMGFSRTTLKLSEYWGKVVKVIQLADWYNADKPDSEDRDVWEFRAAMLDAIFYRPSSKK